MKLVELFEDLYNTTKQDVTVNRDLSRKPKDLYADKEKNGAFSSVADKKNDPFMVRKTSHDDQNKYDVSEYDGYWAFIQGIVDNSELKNNPFLPRVYNVKKIKDVNGKVIMRADIEKLHHGYTFDTDILFPYFINIFGGDYEERMKHYLQEEGDEPEVLIKSAANKMEVAVDSGDYSRIQNPTLVKALKYIASFNDKFEADIRDSNIMFRTGGQGLQLVIIDPIAGKLK